MLGCYLATGYIYLRDNCHIRNLFLEIFCFYFKVIILICPYFYILVHVCPCSICVRVSVDWSSIGFSSRIQIESLLELLNDIIPQI